jgi:hypothetical protein
MDGNNFYFYIEGDFKLQEFPILTLMVDGLFAQSEFWTQPGIYCRVLDDTTYEQLQQME